MTTRKASSQGQGQTANVKSVINLIYGYGPVDAAFRRTAQTLIPERVQHIERKVAQSSESECFILFTTSIDTSSVLVNSSVTSSFDSAWPFSCRLLILNNTLSPIVSKIIVAHMNQMPPRSKGSVKGIIR